MPVIVSKKNQALVVPPNPGLSMTFPGAPSLPGGNIVVPHGIRETLLLRHLGFNVPSPFPLYYDFGASKPFAVQVATATMLTENPRGYVLNHMGTGKTKTALWAWDCLNRAGLVGKLLVVAPLSTLNFVWAREIFNTLPGRRVQVLHGTRRERLDRLATEADIYIINHDGVKTIRDALYARADVSALCLDELAVYRNNSTRSKDMRKFATRFQVVWGMTGAPMPNEPTDVWAQCQIVTPGRVPRYRTHARDMLMTKVTDFKYVPKPDAVNRAFGWMQPSCRYALEDVVELPPLISRTIDVPLSTAQEHTYKRVATAMQAMIKDKTIVAANAGAAMSKLLQIAGGWVYTKNPEYVRVDPTPRILALTELIASAEQKVLVAIPFRHMIEGVSKIFNMKGVEIDHEVVHGDTKDRERIFTLFQDTNKFKVLLVHPATVSHGLTLTVADTILWYLPITSLDVYDQFNARITRVGQTHKQQLLHLQATPIEKKIYRMLLAHQKMQSNFLQLVEEATGDLP